MFAEFGKFREAGFAIPLSIALVLCATLSFSPALLRLAGRWAFWPRRILPATNPPARETAPRPGLLERLWDDVAHHLLRRPGRVWLTTVAVMLPLALVAGLFHGQLSYDLIGDLPADAPSVKGTRVMQEHFPAGMIGPVTVLVVNPNVDFGTDPGRKLVAKLTDRLRAEKEELGLADIRSLTAPLGSTEAAQQARDEAGVPADTRKVTERRMALDAYTSALGERRRIGTRLVLILMHSPFAHWSIADLDRIQATLQDALPAWMRADTQIDFVGTTASVRDLADVTRRDRRRISFLVLASVLVILVLLLRRFVVPVYLLLSVLFSYFVTLGATFAVFWLLDPYGFAGIDWKVAIFLFTILIAVGEDYNIFLIARVQEEEKRHGPVGSVTEALTRTGPIISSCGVIMAGTFGSLLAGSLSEMKQLGFALAFGVLLDTFVVRPILVPAFLILLGTERTRRQDAGVQGPWFRSRFSTLARK
jgi:RND superfamily putative drug exporter